MYDLILKKKAIFILRTIIKKLDLIQGFANADNKIEFLLNAVIDNLELLDDEIMTLLSTIYHDVDLENISAVEYIVLINEVFEANQSFFTKVRLDLKSKTK